MIATTAKFYETGRKIARSTVIVGRVSLLGCKIIRTSLTDVTAQ
jgi:hypothetical protein